jgi:hypothetical protein
LVNRFLRDFQGGALVEFTLTFPMFLLVAFGTVDFTSMSRGAYSLVVGASCFPIRFRPEAGVAKLRASARCG